MAPTGCPICEELERIGRAPCTECELRALRDENAHLRYRVRSLETETTKLRGLQ